MLDKILNLFSIKRRNKNSNEIFVSKYSEEQLPFLLNYEHFNFARGKIHYGNFILPNGVILEYDKPENWNHFNSLSNEIISCDDLFKNLNKCNLLEKKADFFNFKFNEAILSVEKGDLIPIGSACDAGVRTYSILTYDNKTKLFKRIFLKTIGDFELVNKSSYTDAILKIFIASLSHTLHDTLTLKEIISLNQKTQENKS